MPEYESAYVGGLQYIKAKPDTLMYIVYKQWPTGKIEREAAWHTEKLARAHAASLVGKENCLIGLETIPVKDRDNG